MAVLDLVAGADADEAMLLNRAQSLGYELVRPYRWSWSDARQR